jgi:hypothetical protein
LREASAALMAIAESMSDAGAKKEAQGTAKKTARVSGPFVVIRRVSGTHNPLLLC